MSSGAEMFMMQEIETPKGSEGSVDLPCGLLTDDGELYTEAKVREITGNEEDMLASAGVPNEQKMDELIIRCTERLGPIEDPEKLRTHIPNLPIGDRLVLLFRIRMITLGNIYPFGAKCPSCGKVGTYAINLAELEVKKMKDPRKRVFDEQLPSGKEARFRVMTGKDEALVRKARKKHKTDGPSLAILARLELLEGNPPTLDAVKGLGMRDRNFLRKKFTEVEGGVDTTLQITCEGCGHEYEAELDLQGKAFFFPSEDQKG